MSDTSTTTVEQMAVLMEREIRKITRIDDLKSNEAEMLRDLAKERDAARAEIERLTKEMDEARAGRRFTLGLLDRTMTERDEARAMLADAERDMRQRAADFVGQEARTFPDNVAWGVEDVAKAVLALPLKHADREGGA